MLREGLLAKGAMMKMVLEENQNNAAESKKLVRFLPLTSVMLVLLPLSCADCTVREREDGSC